MTQSIFDPDGDPERSGSRNLGPDANQDSHMPDDITDGKVEDVEEAEDVKDDIDVPSPPVG